MIDEFLRFGFLGLGAVALSLVVAWYVALLRQEITGTGQIVIDPLTVIDSSGKSSDELGKALAPMLQSRLQMLVADLKGAQVTTVQATSQAARATSNAVVGDVRLWTQVVSLQTGLLQPVDMKLSVAGVEVGGLLPWLQRWFSSPRTLHFTVYLSETEAQIVGSLAALRIPDSGLRVVVKDVSGKRPAPDAIVDALGHEILHQYLAQDRSNRLEVLNAAEFMSLAKVLVRVGQANRSINLGRPAQQDFAALVPDITALAEKVPDWPELGYLAARIADSGRDAETAVTYYKRAEASFKDRGTGSDVQWIAERIATLASASVGASASADVVLESTADPRAETALPRKLDFASQIRQIRDSGAEGSVVGQALATALEMQIFKVTGKQLPISARFIYYSARKIGGFDLTVDAGALIADGIKSLRDDGAVSEEVWPYKAGQFAASPPAAIATAERFRITGAKSVKATSDSLKAALQRSGAVVVGITLFQSSMNPDAAKSGVIPMPTPKDSLLGGHAVVIVGFDDDKQQFKFANSWGTSWGDKGFGYLPYAYVKDHVSDSWTFAYRTKGPTSKPGAKP